MGHLGRAFLQEILNSHLRIAVAHGDRHHQAAELQGAFLEGTQLQGAILINAKMQGARLFQAQLQGALLIGAWMQGAELERVQLVGALLDKAFLIGARVNDSNLQGASLKSTHLEGAHLDFHDTGLVLGADFSGAHVWHSHLLWITFTRNNRPVAKATELQFSLQVPLEIKLNAANLSASEYDIILSGSISGILDAEVRRNIERSMRNLRADSLVDESPLKLTPKKIVDMFELPWQALQQESTSTEMLQQQKFAIFRSIACRDNEDSTSEGYNGAPYVAQALLKNGSIQSVGKLAPQLATILSDPRSCPGAARLADDLKARLSSIKDGP